jgi:hypothetical protein
VSLMEPQPRDEKPEDDGRCSRCAWREWETAVWVYTALVALCCLVIVLGGAGRP